MPNPTATPKQPDKAASPHAGWLTRAQVAAELGYGRDGFDGPQVIERS